MNLSLAVFTLSLSTALGVCPFKSGSNEQATDGTTIGPCPHSDIDRKGARRLSSLVNDRATMEGISEIIQARSTTHAHVDSLQLSEDASRSLQEEAGCVTFDTYENLHADIASLADAITDVRDRGHFLGGIVRLAAHDFMDFDQSSVAGNHLGSDGCLDFLHPANAGLSDIWCDDPVACPLKALHDGPYSFISRADFWVIAANAVILTTSINNEVVLPFRWGRLDRNPNAPGGSECAKSSSRLPLESGCSEVEGVFLDRMGLSWRDAVALLGAHTLGRGDAAFSGHGGAWVDSDEQSIIFDMQ